MGRPAPLGTKLINKGLANLRRGQPRAQGLTILFYRETALSVVIVAAAHFSAFRTSAHNRPLRAVPGAGRRHADRQDGCGALGGSHIRLLAPLLPAAASRSSATLPSAAPL